MRESAAVAAGCFAEAYRDEVLPQVIQDSCFFVFPFSLLF